MSLHVGQPAPPFHLDSTDGRSYSLSDLRGQRFVLYFYPKDDTPGCTTQACEFRDAAPRFDALGVRVFGVSRDSLKSHDRFRSKYTLPFTLLSDPDGSVHRAYGAWGEKKLYGKVSEGVLRTTVIIDAEGSIAAYASPVKAAGDAERTLRTLG